MQWRVTYGRGVVVGDIRRGAVVGVASGRDVVVTSRRGVVGYVTKGCGEERDTDYEHTLTWPHRKYSSEDFLQRGLQPLCP